MQAEIQLISLVIIQFFFLSPKESQKISKSESVRVCVCEDTAAIFFCFQLMFQLFSLRISAAMPVSRTSFLRLCCLDACSPGTDKGANSGIGTLLGIQLCMCRCVFEWAAQFCARAAAAERAREARRCVFTHAWSIHSPIAVVSTHTLIRISGLSDASATVHQSSMGIKGELHRSRADVRHM